MFKKFISFFQPKQNKIKEKILEEIDHYTNLYETAKKYNLYTDLAEYEKILKLLKSLID